MTKDEFVQRLNRWGAEQKPFLFVADFELQQPEAFLIDEIDADKILFNINGFTNERGFSHHQVTPSILERHPLSFDQYEAMFSKVYDRLSYGDTYLVNLTAKTAISLSHSFNEIYRASNARYKLLYDDRFMVFSPECFVKVKDNRIFSFPMKGTIDAGVPDAARKILADQKELAEHVTIVDLIRNDLSQVASSVEVRRFRYIETIKTDHKNLLQVSSEITGVLKHDFHKFLGDILISLLPAGSVSGAPKQKTVSIIGEAENEKRGFYTGVFGYFDGSQLDSGVMIRYIERDNGRVFYRSGGGITTQSVANLEYQELINKVYVPVD